MSHRDALEVMREIAKIDDEHGAVPVIPSLLREALADAAAEERAAIVAWHRQEADTILAMACQHYDQSVAMAHQDFARAIERGKHHEGVVTRAPSEVKS